MVMRLLLAMLLVCGPAAAQQGDRLRLELVLDPREAPVYENEMLLATIRGVYRDRITNEDLKLRAMTDFDWTRLGHDSWREQSVGGVTARVMERRIALFPKRPGSLEILPIAHELELLGSGGQRETRIVRSDPVKIEVAPRPDTGGAHWLPVRALEVSDNWSADPGALEDGALVERRVVLRALGATPEMMPQQPALREPWLITFSPPEERNMQVTPEGPVTTVVWRWSLRPITGEPGVLPEVVIPYFDTTENRAARAILPAAPIGYASFSGNVTGWQTGLGPVAPLVAVFALALVAALTLSLWRQGRISTPLRRWKLGVIGYGRLMALAARLRRKETAAYRREAARYLREAGLDPDAREETLAAIDGSVFGAAAPPCATGWRNLHRRIRQAARSRRS